ncbi:MAG: shikimate kinase [Oligoflexus sp.]
MENNINKKKDRKVLNRLAVHNVVLVGGTGCGKSTVGFQLARLLGFGICDIDQALEVRSGRKIPEIFQELGEVRFRDMESDIIKEARTIRNHVVVAGGGAIERDENWQVLRELGPVVWLATPTTEVVQRLVMNPEQLRQRPLLSVIAEIEDRKGREQALAAKLDELLQKRMHRYKEADYSLTCSFATQETCAQFIKSILLEHGEDPLPQENLS